MAASLPIGHYVNFAKSVTDMLVDGTGVTAEQITSMISVAHDNYDSLAALDSTDIDKLGLISGTTTGTTLDYALSGSARNRMIVFGNSTLTSTLSVNVSGMSTVSQVLIQRIGGATASRTYIIGKIKPSTKSQFFVKQWSHKASTALPTAGSTVASFCYVAFGYRG